MLIRILFFVLVLASFAANAQNSWGPTNISNNRLEFETYDSAWQLAEAGDVPQATHQLQQQWQAPH
jgi:hypothetical protein